MKKLFFIANLLVMSFGVHGIFYINKIILPNYEGGTLDETFREARNRFDLGDDPLTIEKEMRKEHRTEALEGQNFALSIVRNITSTLMRSTTKPSIREDLAFNVGAGSTPEIWFNLHNTTEFTEETWHILTPSLPCRYYSGKVNRRNFEVLRFAIGTILLNLRVQGDKHKSPDVYHNRFVILDTQSLEEIFFSNDHSFYDARAVENIRSSGYKFFVVSQNDDLNKRQRENYATLKEKLGDHIELVTGSLTTCVLKILERTPEIADLFKKTHKHCFVDLYGRTPRAIKLFPSLESYFSKRRIFVPAQKPH